MGNGSTRSALRPRWFDLPVGQGSPFFPGCRWGGRALAVKRPCNSPHLHHENLSHCDLTLLLFDSRRLLPFGRGSERETFADAEPESAKGCRAAPAGHRECGEGERESGASHPGSQPRSVVVRRACSGSLGGPNEFVFAKIAPPGPILVWSPAAKRPEFLECAWENAREYYISVI